MRRLIVALAAVLLVMPTGCSRSVEGAPSRPGLPATAGHPDEAGKLDPYGFVNGQCGPLSDQTIAKTINADQIYQSFFGALCYWIAADKSGNLIDLLYAYYEGGDVDRDRKSAQGMGQRTEDISINGRKGFTTTGPTSGTACGVTVAAGTGTLTWWVQYRKGGGDACGGARKLVEQIVQTVL